MLISPRIPTSTTYGALMGHPHAWARVPRVRLSLPCGASLAISFGMSRGAFQAQLHHQQHCGGQVMLISPQNPTSTTYGALMGHPHAWARVPRVRLSLPCGASLAILFGMSRGACQAQLHHQQQCGGQVMLISTQNPTSTKYGALMGHPHAWARVPRVRLSMPCGASLAILFGMSRGAFQAQVHHQQQCGGQVKLMSPQNPTSTTYGALMGHPHAWARVP
jgi:hypothetical protein